MTRRQLLLLPGAAPLLGQSPSPGEPQNQTFPLDTVEGTIIPPELFFVRDHFREPEISLSAWRLKIEGRVARPLDLSLADIIELPTKQLEAVLECAGNPAGGTAAGDAMWEGVPLAHLLELAGAAKDAAAVLFEGADAGRLLQNSPSLPYCRLLPAAKCLQPESLLAFKLNGRFLPHRNGFPARALFPGWYGMDSVKWLHRVVVLGPSEPAPVLESSGMIKLYNRMIKSPATQLTVTRLTEVLVKSVIVWPPDATRLPAAQHLVHGFAWTGMGLVRSVSLSADGGRTWAPAQLEGTPKPFSWVRWKYLWTASPGDHVLMSRANDDTGRTQPLKRDPSRKDGYELNFCAPVRCFVR
ncbi:MAG TPA: molybdopterin-dependent oxidoreductase [Bryobacteraceae bacterium]|nr:molybdopterin-dependent oxidoreductase [Bryobacteraceae bacterium]